MQSGAGLSPDLPQGGGGELTPQLPPPRAPGSPGPPRSPDPSELGSPRSSPTFDLLSMVVSYKRMALFLEPITDGLELARFLLGWKMPLCSLMVCLLLNILFLTLNEVGWFSVCVLSVSAPAALGYLQDRCGGGASEEELSRRRSHAVHRRDLQTVHLSRQDAILEVKGLLKQLDDLLSQACQAAESVYKVLYWDSHTQSSRFYGAFLLVLCLLYSVPLGWVLACLNSSLFLLNTHFLRVVCELREGFQPGPECSAEGEGEAESHSGGLDRTPTPTSLEDLSPGSVEEAEEAEPDDEFKDAIEEPPIILQVSPVAGMLYDMIRKRLPRRLLLANKEDDDVAMGMPDYDTISDNGLLSRNEPIRSKVSKLTEKLRKRYPTTATGGCSSCTAVFSVLKKRRSCSNCGNSFCSRCCSYKVLKSSMGATAPEAQRETVFVCAACYSVLSKFA